ncbi:MAG: DUF6264 family protein [Terrimesophilobacter sp.]
MSESERPRPEYGEYASSDEQEAALTRSGVTPPHPVAEGVDSLTPQALRGVSHHEAVEGDSARRVADRLVTVFLISFWAIFVIGDAASFLNLGESLRAPMKQIGIDDFQPTALTAAAGIAMLVSQAVLWALAAAWSYRRLSRRMTAWWVPVVLGALSFIVIVVVLGTLLATDPSFTPALTKF